MLQFQTPERQATVRNLIWETLGEAFRAKLRRLQNPCPQLLPPKAWREVASTCSIRMQLTQVTCPENRTRNLDRRGRQWTCFPLARIKREAGAP